uniref:6,7-dimethyl-8-ribityllumazine synthase n=1 Tax=Fibrocapsa japonica TaxID=94617 RepID=A0A6U1PVR1_9STRA|mmetsp:Transcript_5910/g.8943  ORF Transcript_5910/g.8943 Transcript_5910/m.8943 type:complete len:230 (+) Transcript_5910:72-761(+)|eukprot:CAMPEP_0113938390 /NCGR_PEP_ID=MMETSP1339-20121228/4826_1 /TAXON_ID=94617 /ORGANISM="Fibrocapsa japonica" /LENGTH=229 /DNA_ID=CAMNT_0000941485 /DNA_START=66 /DNA_END=755 /DNA_ORIENTATION=- /assembly_acc=CAM_ASM_000762
MKAVAVLSLVFSAAVAFHVPGLSGLSTSYGVRGRSVLSMNKEVSFGELDGSKVRIGIIKTRWNEQIMDGLSEGVQKSLNDCGVEEKNIFETEVPGSFELPLAARFLAMSNRVDAIICLGCLIKGDTMHFEYIADAVAKGIMNVGISTSVPVVFGVLTCLDEAQAVKRSTGENNHGLSWGLTAVEMALLRRSAMGMETGGAKIAFASGVDTEIKKEKKESEEEDSKKVYF